MPKAKEVKTCQLLINPEPLISVTDEALKLGMQTIQREMWVRKWFNKAKLYQANGHFGFKEIKRLSIVAIDVGVGAPYLGWSRCSPSDTYDRRVGIAVATARAYGEPIPDYI